MSIPRAKAAGRFQLRGWLRFHARDIVARWGVEVLAALAIVGILLVLAYEHPGTPRRVERSKARQAHTVSVMFATAYARWSIDHEQLCPASIYDLVPYMNDRRHALDAWGNEFRMRCGVAAPPEAWGFGIDSAGPDQRFGTDDDITSWERLSESTAP